VDVVHESARRFRGEFKVLLYSGAIETGHQVGKLPFELHQSRREGSAVHLQLSASLGHSRPVDGAIDGVTTGAMKRRKLVGR
jgi:hypothetical protein